MQDISHMLPCKTSHVLAEPNFHNDTLCCNAVFTVLCACLQHERILVDEFSEKVAVASRKVSS